mmetsp:Transcript_7205/g.15722  ORF Transcript_7205/g.15722 Transcript_7205/m.15722 type:complete len:285 (-) Transcript_7205:3700-4554(-)
MLLEPVWTWVGPISQHPIECLKHQLSTIRCIVWQGWLGWGHLQCCSPLCVSVQLQGKLGMLQPHQHVSEGLAVLFWELELQKSVVTLWPHVLWKEEAKGMRVRISRPVHERPNLTLFGDFVVNFVDEVLDDPPHSLSLQWDIAFDSDMEPTIHWLGEVGLFGADANTAEEDSGAALALHASVIGASSADDTAEDVGPVEPLCQKMVQEDLLLPRVLGLRHRRRGILWEFGHFLWLRWCSCRRRWYNLNCGFVSFLLRGLHVQDGHSQISKLSWPEDVLLGQCLD